MSQPSPLPKEASITTQSIGIPIITSAQTLREASFSMQASSITDAFPINISKTSMKLIEGGVLIYSNRSLPALASITGAPVLVTTAFDEIAETKTTHFAGILWVGPHGRFWWAPSLPKKNSKGIRPPCLWPFCNGSEGTEPGAQPEEKEKG